MAADDKLYSATNPLNVSAADNTGVSQDYSDTLQFIWNDVNCLGAILVTSTLIGCFLIHHVDLRQRLMGARMRIACCSLIYRKVYIYQLVAKHTYYLHSYIYQTIFPDNQPLYEICWPDTCRLSHQSFV